ncbi:hypothetical protein F2Q70_00018607 [Brassica cretica]|uniref:Major facilitator superfamily (MFS) profile domain-containing protein n=1 Tax=Brassica cretica TaxID=69181 RepID=A0A8S9HZC0_BRACR|nr:hypothetical protein F2Q70_00018607 [Brassica cretica]
MTANFLVQNAIQMRIRTVNFPKTYQKQTRIFSAFGSFSTLGATFGALFSGKMAIMLGRKGTMWVSNILCITGWLCIAFAKDVLWLNIGRFSSGIGLGLISYVVPVYIAEITPKHVRGTFTFSNQLLQNCGLAMVYFCGNFINWRMMALIGALPCFIQGIGLFFVPESPRWLAKAGTDKDLENSLLRLRGRDADISSEASEIQVMTKMLESDSKSSFSDLLQRKYRHTLVVGIGLMLIQQFSGSTAVLCYANTIFRKAGVENREKIPKTLLAKEKVDENLDYKELSMMTEGYTGSDLKEKKKQRETTKTSEDDEGKEERIITLRGSEFCGRGSGNGRAEAVE